MFVVMKTLHCIPCTLYGYVNIIELQLNSRNSTQNGPERSCTKKHEKSSELFSNISSTLNGCPTLQSCQRTIDITNTSIRPSSTLLLVLHSVSAIVWFRTHSLKLIWVIIRCAKICCCRRLSLTPITFIRTELNLQWWDYQLTNQARYS